MRSNFSRTADQRLGALRTRERRPTRSQLTIVQNWPGPPRGPSFDDEPTSPAFGPRSVRGCGRAASLGRDLRLGDQPEHCHSAGRAYSGRDVGLVVPAQSGARSLRVNDSGAASAPKSVGDPDDRIRRARPRVPANALATLRSPVWPGPATAHDGFGLLRDVNEQARRRRRPPVHLSATGPPASGVRPYGRCGRGRFQRRWVGRSRWSTRARPGRRRNG